MPPAGSGRLVVNPPPIRRGEACNPRAVATRLVAAIRTFARSEVGWRAKLIFATILVGERESTRLREHVGRIAKNFRRITTVNRNVGFFSTGYNWLVQLIPILIIAPAFMRGEIEFGVITQSTMVFTTLVAAFSLVVTQFQSLSTYAAVVSRLGSLLDAFESEAPASAAGSA